ncbi:MAG: homocysteine S-methyltransferase family protein [Acidobacteriota bacterium]
MNRASQASRAGQPFRECLQDCRLVLMEGGVLERLRRDARLPVDSPVANAALLYSEEGRAAMGAIYREYMRIGVESGLPVLALTPTWRASPERIVAAGFSGRDVNAEAVRFLHGLRAPFGEGARGIFVGGLMGCRGDAYRPQEALSAKEAERFHHVQAWDLAWAGADCLLASTLPALCEAAGLASAMAETGLPYLISFIIRSDGRLLDGTPFPEAVKAVDGSTDPPPAGYLLNCVHPSAVARAEGLWPGWLAQRWLGLQANSSDKAPEELDGSPVLEASGSPQSLAEQMLGLRRRWGLKLLGGCCGTDGRLIRALARGASEESPP